jgi:hypothetical protein
MELRTPSQDTPRRRWVTTLALLRAVGHVLDKVDGPTSAIARTVIDDAYKAMKDTAQPAIFWGFIEDERNNVLKQYRFAVQGNLTIGMPPAGAGIPLALGVVAPGGVGIITDELGTRYVTSKFEVRPLTDGPFAGREPIAVVQEAIAFWHTYLDDIDSTVARRQAPTKTTGP